MDSGYSEVTQRHLGPQLPICEGNSPENLMSHLLGNPFGLFSASASLF